MTTTDMLAQFVTDGSYFFNQFRVEQSWSDEETFGSLLALAFHLTNNHPAWWGAMSRCWVEQSPHADAFRILAEQLVKMYPVGKLEE